MNGWAIVSSSLRDDRFRKRPSLSGTRCDMALSWLGGIFGKRARQVDRKLRQRRRARLGLEQLEDRLAPAVFNVTTTADSLAPGTLRSSIIAANATPGADIIRVPAGSYALTLTGAGEDAAASGDLDITEAVTIRGTGAGPT